MNDKQKLLSGLNSNSEAKLVSARTADISNMHITSHYSSMAGLRTNTGEAPIENEFKPIATPPKQESTNPAIEMAPIDESLAQNKSKDSQLSAGRDRIWGSKVRISPSGSFIGPGRTKNRSSRSNSKSPREIARSISKNH